MNETTDPRKTIVWALSGLLGALLVVWGVGELLNAVLNDPASDFIELLTLDFIPRPLLGLGLACAGALLGREAFRRVRRDVAAMETTLPLVGGAANKTKLGGGRRPKVVIFAGTEGLMMLLRIANEVPWDVVGVVPPIGAGVSFARLRRELHISPDQVVFPTLYPVEVVAELENGDQLRGHVAIATNKSGSRIKSVRLETHVAPGDQRAQDGHLGAPELVPLLKDADALVIGPGSLFTNLIPTLLVKEVNDALRTTEARKIFVCNIMTQPNQTDGFTAADHVKAIQDNCGIQLDYVLVASPVNVSQDVLGRYEQMASEVVRSVSRPGDAAYLTLFEGSADLIKLVHGAILVERDDLIQEQPIVTHGEGAKVVLRHWPERLAQVITDLVQDVALQARLSVSRAVFREYDVRGVAGEQLTERTMYVMGRAFGTFVQRRTGRNRVVLGRDARLSSEAFHEQFERGLVQSGCKVFDVGMVPTPLLQFAAVREFTDGAAMITASHNPPEFNGVKVQLGANAVAGPELQHIERIVAAGRFLDGEGDAEPLDVLEPYLNCLLSKVKPAKKLKVVLDAGNGTAGPTAVRSLEMLGCEVIPMYTEPDGTFPNHPPDPLEEENIEDLKARVLQEDADLGVAFDGDGDRLGVVDELGRMVMPDQYLSLFARQILEEGPAKIVFEVRCSQALVDDIAAHGGVPIMVKCGNAAISQRMREERARLGGELSGHVFFDDPPITYDDPIYGASRLVEYLSNQDAPLSELVDALPRYHSSPELRVFCPDHMKFQVVDDLRDYFINNGDEWGGMAIAKVLDVDGIRVTMADGAWFLVRASNTQARLSVRVEAKTEAGLYRLMALVGQELIKRVPESRHEIEEKMIAAEPAMV
jgi:phosphomannomutase/phosphoglucomutase